MEEMKIYMRSRRRSKRERHFLSRLSLKTHKGEQKHNWRVLHARVIMIRRE